MIAPKSLDKTNTREIHALPDYKSGSSAFRPAASHDGSARPTRTRLVSRRARRSPVILRERAVAYAKRRWGYAHFLMWYFIHRDLPYFFCSLILTLFLEKLLAGRGFTDNFVDHPENRMRLRYFAVLRIPLMLMSSQKIALRQLASRPVLPQGGQRADGGLRDDRRRITPPANVRPFRRGDYPAYSRAGT